MQPTQQAQSSEQTQRVAAVDEAESSARAETEKSRPTVNAEGQVVGSRINTTVLRDGASELLIKNANTILRGKGLLFFGRPFNNERRGGVRYESN